MPSAGFLSGAFEEGIAFVTDAADAALTGAGVSLWMHSFIIDGVFTGVGTVLSFLPVIVILFFFLSILEDSGYMARVAFVMDSSLRKIGLSGRSFVPMLIGLGAAFRRLCRHGRWRATGTGSSPSSLRRSCHAGPRCPFTRCLPRRFYAEPSVGDDLALPAWDRGRYFDRPDC